MRIKDELVAVAAKEPIEVSSEGGADMRLTTPAARSVVDAVLDKLIDRLAMSNESRDWMRGAEPWLRDLRNGMR